MRLVSGGGSAAVAIDRKPSIAAPPVKAAAPRKRRLGQRSNSGWGMDGRLMNPPLNAAESLALPVARATRARNPVRALPCVGRPHRRLEGAAAFQQCALQHCVQRLLDACRLIDG